MIPWFYNQGSSCEIVAIDQTRFYICLYRMESASRHHSYCLIESIATSPSPKDRAIVVSVVPVEACVNFLLTGNNECGRYRVCGIRYKIIISFSFHITKLEMKINLLYILMCRNFRLIEKTRGSAAGCACRPNPCLLAKIN